MTIEHIEKLIALDDYDDILNTLPLLIYVDLDRLVTSEERICFFTNLYNFFLIIYLKRKFYVKVCVSYIQNNIVITI